MFLPLSDKREGYDKPFVKATKDAKEYIANIEAVLKGEDEEEGESEVDEEDEEGEEDEKDDDDKEEEEVDADYEHDVHRASLKEKGKAKQGVNLNTVYPPSNQLALTTSESVNRSAIDPQDNVDVEMASVGNDGADVHGMLRHLLV